MLRADRTQPFGFVREVATRWDSWRDRGGGRADLLRRGQPRPVRAAVEARASRCRFAGASARIRGAHHAAHVRGDGRVAGLHLHLRHLAAKSRARREACWCRCSTSCSRCRSWASSRSPSCSSCRWRRGACWAPSSPPSSRSSPARPGTWPSASTSRCARMPDELDEAARIFHLIAWMRFWRLEVPFAMPALHLEHDDVDVGRLVLRGGLGGDHASATPTSRCPASAPTSRWPSSSATCARSAGRSPPCSIVILLYDQLLFRPLIAGPTGSASSRSRAHARRTPGR